MDLFPDGNSVRELQKELDKIIERGIHKLKILFQKSQAGKPVVYFIDQHKNGRIINVESC